MIIYNRRKIPVLYLFICRLMQERAKSHLYITYAITKELFARRLYFLPIKYRLLLLKEMEELKLIRKIGRKNSIKYEFLVKDAEKLLRQQLPIF